MRRPLPLALRRPVFGLLGRALPEGRLGAARVPRQDHLRGAGARLGRGLLPQRCRSCATPMRRAAVQRARFKARARRLHARSRCSSATPRAPTTDDPLALIQYLDLKTYLVGDINTKVDRASMAHSLEVREPLMDHPLVEWLATLPSVAQAARRRGQVPASRRRWSRICRARSCTGRRWASRCRWRRWFRGPLRERVREAVLGRAARRHRLVQRGVPAAAGRAAPVRGARLQRAAVDAADVRGVPAGPAIGPRRRGRRSAPGGRSPANGGVRPTASPTPAGRVVSRAADPDVDLAFPERRPARATASSSRRGCASCWRAGGSPPR